MTEYPAVTFLFHTTPEQERTSLRDLELPARAEGVLLRAGLKTVGDIISRWYDLGNVRQRTQKWVSERLVYERSIRKCLPGYVKTAALLSWQWRSRNDINQ